MTNKKLELHEISIDPEDWDRKIAEYANATVFHLSGWHAHLRDIHPTSVMQYFEIREDAKSIVGYYCELKIRKAGIKIFGSPIGGTGTNYMGPVFDSLVYAAAIARLLAGRVGLLGVWHYEVATENISEQQFSDCGFDTHKSVTHMVNIPDEIEEAWQSIKGTARNRVKKAEKNGLVVEQANDRAIADEYFEQFIEVYGKQGMVTPFGVERPRSLFTQLNDSNNLLALRIRHEGRVVATGLFPYDKNSIYFWGAASWLDAQKLCPNELLHWSVIKFAVENGIRNYNMCGGCSQFKNKFGGDDVPYNTYSKSATPLLRYGRAMYRKLHFYRLKIKR